MSYITTHSLVVRFLRLVASCIKGEVALGSKYFSFQWVYNTYCPLHQNLWQRKPSLASGLRPRPRRFTAINSDVVDKNYNIFLCDTLFSLNLVQLVTEPTHIHGNILDIIATNVPQRIVNLEVNTSRYNYSDHYFHNI